MPMSHGDVVTVDLGDDTTMTLVLEERVYPDPTYGQWDAGWLAYRPADIDDENADTFFVSVETAVPRVYGPDDDGHARRLVGQIG